DHQGKSEAGSRRRGRDPLKLDERPGYPIAAADAQLRVYPRKRNSADAGKAHRVDGCETSEPSNNLALRCSKARQRKIRPERRTARRTEALNHSSDLQPLPNRRIAVKENFHRSRVHSRVLDGDIEGAHTVVNGPSGRSK